MESLDNLEPYDDLEDWLDDVNLFMEAMCHPPHMADVLWQEAKLKKQKEIPKPHLDEYLQPEKNDPPDLIGWATLSLGKIEYPQPNPWKNPASRFLTNPGLRNQKD